MTEGAAEWEDRFGGCVAQNADHVYRLTEAQQAYLMTLDPPISPDALLAQMNGREVTAEAGPRALLAEHGGVSGKVRHPLLTLKSTTDGLTPAFHDALLAEQVHGKSEANLLQLYTADKPTHCTFTVEQVTLALGAMESWIDTGARPAADSFGRLSGFDPDFVPPPWPFAP